jgi:hypothetical protein
MLDFRGTGQKFTPVFLSSSALSVSTGFQFDYVFDWTILKYQQSQIPGAPARANVSLE